MKKVLMMLAVVLAFTALNATISFAASGGSLFSSEGCIGCHTINGTGGSVGPDLSHEGGKRSLGWIKTQISDPASHFAPGSSDGSYAAIMPATSMSSGELNALASYIESLK